MRQGPSRDVVNWFDVTGGPASIRRRACGERAPCHLQVGRVSGKRRPDHTLVVCLTSPRTQPGQRKFGTKGLSFSLPVSIFLVL